MHFFNMGCRDTDQEITVLEDGIRILENNIRQTESIIHWTPRPQTRILPDSETVTGQRPSTGASYTPLADQLRFNEPRENARFLLGPERIRQTEQQFGDMFGLSDIVQSLSNGQFISKQRPRHLVDNDRGYLRIGVKSTMLLMTDQDPRSTTFLHSV
jgi:hypothetical protein